MENHLSRSVVTNDDVVHLVVMVTKNVVVVVVCHIRLYFRQSVAGTGVNGHGHDRECHQEGDPIGICIATKTMARSIIATDPISLLHH